MALDHSRLRMLMKVIKEYGVRGDVLTVGVQDIIDTHENIEALVRANGFAPAPIPPAERRYRTSKGQRIFKQFFNVDNPMHGDDVFRMLGFGAIHSVDAFDNDAPTLIHDLNDPLPAEYHGRYDFVVDIGCSEHIFDVRQTMKNLMDALKLGGVLCYYVPMYGWHNECFHNFQPPLFFDAFAANGFDHMKMYLNYFPKYYLRDSGKTLWREYQYGDRTKFRKALHFTHLLFTARKVRQQNGFVSPLMAYYVHWFEKSNASPAAGNPHEESHYMLENLPAPIKRMLPGLIPIYRVMPYVLSAPIVDAMIFVKNRRKLQKRERFWL